MCTATALLKTLYVQVMQPCAHLVTQEMAESAHATVASIIAACDAASPLGAAGSESNTDCSRSTASSVAGTPSALYACAHNCPLSAHAYHGR